MRLTIRDKEGNLYTNEQLGFKVHVNSIPEVIQKQIISDILPISHKEVVYDEILQPRLITIEIGYYINDELMDNIFALNELLNENLTIMFDDGPLSCDVRLNTFEQHAVLGKYMKFHLVFETLTAFRYSWQYCHEELTEDWNYTKLGVQSADKTSYAIVEDQTIQCKHLGQVDVNPIFRLFGTWDAITIGGMTYSNPINGELIIDCDKKLCYQTLDGGTPVLENRKEFLSGDWLTLTKGVNDISISGMNLNLQLDIIYRHTYL